MWLGIGIGVAVFFVLSFLLTYKVIGPNEAHIIVFMGRGRKIKSPVATPDTKATTAYFFIPFLMKRYILPLTNVKLDVNDILLNDKEVAPFVCDVVTWLRISEPVKAVERLDLTSDNVFESLHKDLDAIVKAVARAASMKQEILDIMRDRATFATGVSKEVDVILKEWGVQLVNLEVNEIRDAENSSVIQDYEVMRKASIKSLARKEVALRDREAIEAEQDNRQKAEVAKATAEQTFQTKQIERDTVVGIATQDKDKQIALAEQETNKQKVAALQVEKVGTAEVVKQATITEATGRSEAIRIEGEKKADVVRLTGQAEGAAIEARGVAEAKAKDAMAEALKKFNESATVIEKIRASIEIQKAFAEAYGKIAENAEIKVVTSGGESGNLLGFNMNASTGANLGQMLEAIGTDKLTDILKSVTGDKKE